MSIDVTSWVWAHSTHKGAKLLMMLALADNANDEGVCWPGHTKLAKKARVTKGRAGDILQELKTSGEIGIEIHKGGKTPFGCTNRYFLNGYRKSINLSEGGIDSTPLPEIDPVGGDRFNPPGGIDLLNRTVNRTIIKDISTKDITFKEPNVTSSDDFPWEEYPCYVIEESVRVELNSTVYSMPASNPPEPNGYQLVFGAIAEWVFEIKDCSVLTDKQRSRFGGLAKDTREAMRLCLGFIHDETLVRVIRSHAKECIRQGYRPNQGRDEYNLKIKAYMQQHREGILQVHADLTRPTPEDKPFIPAPIPQTKENMDMLWQKMLNAIK